ncbi:hypothetical protein [Aureimonas leprariae]|uniref:Uncharacterized protein n=1 Tax=Plantimonas leprariae TaxID=2615207 RepID=A0A7V7PKD9_9HYPH|nr:hypothetical protein [Aureimonas leprariae]KAB0676278.1 hypothetical protein F6X38_21470 [Aureimonas leprariae]
MPRTDRLSRPCHVRRAAVALAVAWIGLAGPAGAQEDADVDLKPADFVPEEPIAIRVDDLQPGKQGSDVSVTVANRTKKDVEAVAECTLYDADREDLGVATGEAVKVAAGGRKATTVTGAEGAKFAECRVRGAQ